MNKRAESKQKTRFTLMQAAREEFVANGFLYATTADIAARAGVAHGTLFLHFQTKRNLILEILDREFLEVTDELHRLLYGDHDLGELLERYLDFLERSEPFFAVVCREMPYYPMKLRRQIMLRESAVRHYFYNALERGIRKGKYKDVDITMALSMLFETLHSLLANRELFADQASVIAEKRKPIAESFKKLISI